VEVILVSGAAGKTGLAVIAALAQRGKAVRALVKDGRQAARVQAAGALQIAIGNMEQPEAWQEALGDISAVYHIGPNMHPHEAEIGRNAVQEARRAGVGHFVYHSVLHPQTEAMPHHWQKLRVEEAILASGLPFTILQPAAYMQNMLGGWELVSGEGILRAPYPVETRLSLVHLADVAEVAALVVGEPQHAGATYELVGTEPLAQTEVAAQLGQALGREVQAQETELETWRREAEQGGMAPYARQTLLKMFRYYADFGFAGNSGVLTWLLGRRARSLADFVREVVAA